MTNTLLANESTPVSNDDVPTDTYKVSVPRVPFKDSNGATITECRRKIFDRRIHSIQAKWIEEIVIH